MRARAETVARRCASGATRLLFRYLDDNRHDKRMYDLIRWQRAIFGLSHETLRQIRRESPANVRHLLMIPRMCCCAGTLRNARGLKCKTLFMLARTPLVPAHHLERRQQVQPRADGLRAADHVRALVVTDPVGRVMCRSLIRLVLRSDTPTPVIFCDPMFFIGYSRELQRDLRAGALAGGAQEIPVVHAGSVLPVGTELCEGLLEAEPESRRSCLDDESARARTARLPGVLPRRQITFEAVRAGGEGARLRDDLGGARDRTAAPYTYSEELPTTAAAAYARRDRKDGESPILVVATLPRADSPSAKRYVAEREGETAWTMNLSEKDMRSVEKVSLPDQVGAQIGLREHVSGQATTSGGTSWGTFDPNARADDEGVSDVLPPNYKAPSLDE